MNRMFWPVLVLVAAAAMQVACSTGGGATAEEYVPATVEQVEGTDVSRVILTATAAQRLGIQVEPLREESAGPTTHSKPTGNTVVATGALLYDTAGAVWVYVAIVDPAAESSGLPLTYQREEVTIARIQGDLAFLSSGPAPGTPIVIVGAAELLGTENGVEGE